MVVRIAETYVKVDNAFSPIHFVNSIDDITSESKKSKVRLLFKVFRTSPNFYPLSPNKLGFLMYKVIIFKLLIVVYLTFVDQLQLNSCIICSRI
ncbi:hypothetical protein Hanom_Chr08g00708981 [Helianthus anomalus]